MATLDWVKAGAYVAAVSQFTRAQETYHYMSLPQIDPLVLSGLNEQDWGDFMSSNPPEGLRNSFDAVYKTDIDVKPPGGESTFDLYNRLRATLYDLDAKFSNANMIFVAHGRALLVLRMIVESIPPTDAGWQFMQQNVRELPNCGGFYYPDLHQSRQMAILRSPYPSLDCFLWLPFLNSSFEAASL